MMEACSQEWTSCGSYDDDDDKHHITNIYRHIIRLSLGHALSATATSCHQIIKDRADARPEPAGYLTGLSELWSGF